MGVLPVAYYLVAASATNPTAPLNDFWHAAPGAYVPPFNAFGLDPTSTNVTFANPFPVATSTQVIPVLLTVPNANSGHSKPEAGWPIVIFQHGITRSREDMFAIAATLAGQGFAVIAIDAPLHGITNKTDPFFHNQLLTGTPAAGLITGERTFDLDLENGAGAPGPDGTIDPSGTYFINLSNLLVSRDNLRQATADLMELTRAIPSLSLGRQPDRRLRRIENRIRRPVAGLDHRHHVHCDGTARQCRPAQCSRRPASRACSMPRRHSGRRSMKAWPRPESCRARRPYDAFFVAAQTVVDSGDSINFAFADAGKAILAQEVVGDASHPSDQVIPNSVPTAPLSGTEPLLAALGLSSLTQTTQAAQIRGAVRFTQGVHGSLLDPTSSAAVTAEMQGEMASMIASQGQAVLITNTSVIRTQ